MNLVNLKLALTDKRFSIRELEQLSQIKAHTIRIWEQRYQLFRPQRTLGNNRRYEIEDLQRLLYTATLTAKGKRISNLAALSVDDIANELASFTAPADRKEWIKVQLIIAMYTINIEGFEDLLDDSVLSFGIDRTLEEIILPFLERVRLTSYNKSGSEVHLAVTAIRRKLVYGMETVVSSAKKEASALLFLPEAEHYDLVLLYMAYTLKKAGIRVYYMGTNISTENLLYMAAIKHPDYFFMYTPFDKMKKLESFFESLKQYPLITKLYIVSDAVTEMDDRSTLSLIHYKDFAAWLSFKEIR